MKLSTTASTLTSAAPVRVNVLGVGITTGHLESSLAVIQQALASRTKGYVCVTGVHGVMEAQRDASMRTILNGSLLTTADGMPMVWLGRLAGFRDMDRVYGPDLMLRVFQLTQDGSYTHFLYGGAAGVAERLKSHLEVRFPGIRIVGTYTPPFRALTDVEQTHLVQSVNETAPDIIWVGLSTPKQEKFMAVLHSRFSATLMFGVGAAFDFHIGRLRQAPRWMQKAGLEWLFRLAVEPRRLWRRYLRNNPAFILRIFGQLSGITRYTLD